MYSEQQNTPGNTPTTEGNNGHMKLTRMIQTTDPDDREALNSIRELNVGDTISLGHLIHDDVDGNFTSLYHYSATVQSRWAESKVSGFGMDYHFITTSGDHIIIFA